MQTDGDAEDVASHPLMDRDPAEDNDLNTLYYAVTITVSPPKLESDYPVPKEPALPYKEKLEKRVEIARKLALTTAHMRLAAAASKLQKYLDRTKHNKNNRLFETSHKAFYDSLRTTTQVVDNPPTQTEISPFWGELFGRKSKHREDAPWMIEEAKSVTNVKEELWQDITTDKL
eukprot:9299923-Ditylum_brightwellii.AAC.1